MPGRKTLRYKSRSPGSRKMYRKGGMISGISGSSGSSGISSSSGSLGPFTLKQKYLGSNWNFPNTWAGDLLTKIPNLRNECSAKKNNGETLTCSRGLYVGSYKNKEEWDKKIAGMNAKYQEEQNLVKYYNEVIDNTKKRSPTTRKVALGRRCKWQLIGSECINGATCRKKTLNSVGEGNYCLPKGYRTNANGGPPLTIEEIDENPEATKFKPSKLTW